MAVHSMIKSESAVPQAKKLSLFIRTSITPSISGQGTGGPEQQTNHKNNVIKGCGYDIACVLYTKASKSVFLNVIASYPKHKQCLYSTIS